MLSYPMLLMTMKLSLRMLSVRVMLMYATLGYHLTYVGLTGVMLNEDKSAFVM